MTNDTRQADDAELLAIADRLAQALLPSGIERSCNTDGPHGWKMFILQTARTVICTWSNRGTNPKVTVYVERRWQTARKMYLSVLREDGRGWNMLVFDIVARTVLRHILTQAEFMSPDFAVRITQIDSNHPDLPPVSREAFVAEYISLLPPSMQRQALGTAH